MCPIEGRLFEVRRSSIHGSGVFAVQAISAEVELIDYHGKLISHAAADRKYAGSADSGHTFLFTLNEHYIIDANVDGNDARWINHSCAPNCRAMVVESESGKPRDERVVIESIRAIAAGEELTYDYGIVLEQRHTTRMKRLWACLCGASTCTGTMLKSKLR
ncbi:MAG: SET domain-containing protein [Pseudomarimonas sp.]